MYAQPNPKKLAFLKAQADKLLAEAEVQRQIELAYREARTGQQAFLDANPDYNPHYVGHRRAA